MTDAVVTDVKGAVLKLGDVVELNPGLFLHGGEHTGVVKTIYPETGHIQVWVETLDSHVDLDAKDASAVNEPPPPPPPPAADPPKWADPPPAPPAPAPVGNGTKTDVAAPPVAPPAPSTNGGGPKT